MKTLILFCLSSICLANITQVYKGTARLKTGAIVYYESHKITFDDQKNVLKSVTDYTSPEGNKLAKMTSDYTQNLTSPDYTFKNLKDGSSHGVRFERGHYVLFMKEKSGKEKIKSFSQKKFKKSAMIVGGQGLHFYLVKNLQKVKNMDELALKFLIPGKLDYFSFYLTTVRETDKYLDFKVRIDNFFLRLFAPSLQMRYDKESGHLLSYSGLSNIADKNGDIQNVSITYEY